MTIDEYNEAIRFQKMQPIDLVELKKADPNRYSLLLRRANYSPSGQPGQPKDWPLSRKH